MIRYKYNRSLTWIRKLSKFSFI